jgi:hypothetical protein
MFVFDQASQLTHGRGYWKGREAFSGKIFLSYDELRLHLAAIVLKTGKVLNDQPLPSLWDGDGLELFLSLRTTGEGPSQGDVHLGFTPGTEAKDPRMYCFNRDQEVRGGRVVALPTQAGYILEASVPWDFFEGLDLGPGKEVRLNVRLNEGGFNGQRIAQFDLSGRSDSAERPELWSKVRWIGKATASIPRSERPGVSPGSVEDGTKGLTFLGLRTLKGQVVDAKGTPLRGAWVSTWPKTARVPTGEDGSFELKGVKAYDKTRLYAWAPGHGTALAGSPSGGARAVLKCPDLGMGERGKGGPSAADILGSRALSAGKEGLEKAERPVRVAVPVAPSDKEAWLSALERSVAQAKAGGLKPLVEVPLDPILAAEAVRRVNLTGKQAVRYWIVGNAPDASLPPGLTDREALSALINGHRSCFNAMKSLDPSLVILGPELSGKYRGGEGDWLTPFLAFNGDILDIISIQRSWEGKEEGLKVKDLRDILRGERALLRNLKGRTTEALGEEIPLALTSTWGRREPGLGKGSGDFLGILWAAEQAAIALREGAFVNILSAPPGPDEDWTTALLSALSGMRGEPVEGRWTAKLPDLSFHAFKDGKRGEVSLLIVNWEDRTRRVRVRLDGGRADLSLEAGIGREFDHEAPGLSVSLTKVKSGATEGEMIVHSKSLAEKASSPARSKLKVW